ncbi:two-component sensor histidine kinase [Starkeya sp. ORNL1]|uniref:ATP-binding protein n=1 Tax=Starkeya sp. ORNL1 TaxID=2709380 RepID=UPI00146372E0|nr:ATP-binding protein [Starkeya sp. ORNL1]QJP14785.1 two-component sensor histidine kinase [Starkeya sp. ORNL1]
MYANSPRTLPGDNALVLTGAPPSRAQKLVALGVVPTMLALAFCVARPFATVQLRPIEAFVPFYVTTIFVTDVVTAVILFSQFSILRTRGLLIIANGYVFAALVLIPYALSFPGLFESGTVLVGGLQSTAWIYILRHCGLAAYMSAFALSNSDAKNATVRSGVRKAIFLSISATIVIVLAVSALCLWGQFLLPTATADNIRFGSSWFYYAGAPTASFYGLAMMLLWRQRRTVLGLWLIVVAFVHLAGIPLSFFPSSSRFSVGWYTVVMTNLTANSLVLIILLVQISTLYTHVLLAVRAQQREREARLVTGDAVAAMIAHEVKQPLAAMITRAEASLRRLERSAPELDKAKDDIKQITADGYRAADIIDSIRANFKKDQRMRAALDVHNLIADTTVLIRDELQKQRIALKIELNSNRLDVSGDRTQLQHVLLNLVSNAAESMAAARGTRVLTVRTELRDNNEVVVSVADTGTGISPQNIERIFNPLFTTKTTGMGMGLPICRSIIEAHGGRIWVAPNTPQGAVFNFALSLDATAAGV